MMWMMGYNDGAGEFNTIQDPFTGRKLRPLMPRPVPAAANAAAANASTNLPCLSRVDHFLGINHHHLAMVEQNKRELATQQVVVSTRWNPTPEQLQTLEELYRRGTRTPTAEQIQQITAQLRRYGKIEGKNVFYWFQNHKARERQKRRRQVEPISDDQQQQQQQPDNNNNNYKIEKEEKPPGSNRTAFEVEQTKNWASPTNSSTIPQKTTQGGTKGADQAECKADGWLQFDDAAAAEILLQQQQQRRRRNATWQMMHLSPSSTVSTSSHSPPLSSSSSPSPSPSPTNPIINNNHHHHHHYNPIPPNTMYHDVTIPLMDHHHHHFINIFNNLEHYRDSAGDDDDDEDEAAQTLELFPLQSGQGLNDEECGPMSHAPAYQFFEFLPMKN